MSEYTLDRESSITSLLYICQSLGGAWDKYSLLKILYFAECKHLLEYGRPITGDPIIALEHGPVPSFAYQLLREPLLYRKHFALEDDVVKAIQPPDMQDLSASDVRFLNESIAENSILNFAALKIKSIGAAYTQAVSAHGLNAIIPYIEIARAAGASSDMIAYICDQIDLNDCK
jgi:uncharacterized phage-associated protein